MTHRGLSTRVSRRAGHDEASFAAATAGIGANHLTLVVLMGVGRASAIAWILAERTLLESRGTAAAIVTDASTPTQHVWRGTLDDLAAGRHAGRRRPHRFARHHRRG